MAKKPTGIKILCIANILAAVFFVVGLQWLSGSFTVVAAGGLYGTLGQPISVTVNAPLVVAVIKALAILVITYGIWTAKNWARIFYAIILAFSIFFTLQAAFESFPVISLLVRVVLVLLAVVEIAIVYYLMRADVKAYFGIENLSESLLKE